MPPPAHLVARRERVAAAWGLRGECVLIAAGEPVPIPGGADQTYPFISHAEYYFLAEDESPGGVLAFDPDAGWTLFTPDITESERIWEGREDHRGKPATLLAGWLAQRRGRPLHGLGAELPGLRSDPGRVSELRQQLTESRRPKDEVELGRLRQAAAATAAGYAAVPAWLKPGVTERRVAIELEAEFFRAGASRVGYSTIVGAGPNAATLHFAPSQRVLQAGEFVLIDAGAEVDRYVCDATRTFTVGSSGSADQAALYDLVRRAQERAITRCRAGVEFREVHLDAAHQIAQGLIEMDILIGTASSLVEQDAHALFFPHGLGHLVGLGVRDASGYAPGRKRSPRFGLAALRVDLPLGEDFVITIEPGVYFIPALLNDPDRRARYKNVVNWKRVEGLMHIGGVRIEDNIRITTGAPEILTAAIPK